MRLYTNGPVKSMYNTIIITDSAKKVIISVLLLMYVAQRTG